MYKDTLVQVTELSDLGVLLHIKISFNLHFDRLPRPWNLLLEIAVILKV